MSATFTTRDARNAAAAAQVRRTQPAPATACVVGFYLVPDFPLMAFASAIEPLRAANRLRGYKLFEWRLYSRDGMPVRASNGIDIGAHAGIDDAVAPDILLVCAGTRDACVGEAAVSKWLRGLARRGTALGGISLGAYVLARAGLLDGRRCALHWESLAAFAEAFPRIRTTTDIFVVDGDRRTCSGGTAALDMMLHLITERDGRALANDVSDQFIHPRIRDTQDAQRMPVQSRVGVANEKLIAAIGLMEAGNDDASMVRDIASKVGLSARQLERLFEKYLGATPSQHYLKLRLARARAMLQQTTRPVLDVAVACGFASASHFSRCYRTLYGHKPSDERVAVLATRFRPQRR